MEQTLQEKKKIDDVLFVADNAKDEVYEIAQFLKNDDSVWSVGFLNDGPTVSDISIVLFS